MKLLIVVNTNEGYDKRQYFEMFNSYSDAFSAIKEYKEVYDVESVELYECNKISMTIQKDEDYPERDELTPTYDWMKEH
jgi:hypothetical protein